MLIFKNTTYNSWYFIKLYICLDYLDILPCSCSDRGSRCVAEYVGVFYPNLIDPQTGALSLEGIPAAISMLLAFSIFHSYSLKWLVKANNILTLFQILVPVTISISFIVLCYKLHELKIRSIDSTVSFMPYGIDGIFTAVSL